MMQQVGSSHSLKPEFWERWAKKYGLTIDQWIHKVEVIIRNDLNRGYNTVFDLCPEDLQDDYISAWKSATMERNDMNTSSNLSGEAVLIEKEVTARKKNEMVDHVLKFGAWVNSEVTGKPVWAAQQHGVLKFQKGAREEVGVNGLFFAEELMPALIQHLRDLNEVLPSRETSIAITKMEEAKMWLFERRAKREEQGVLGTYKPHQS